ncbi:MAG: AAA family ATPase [Isosphaeraceae bacterium]|nr:AAA family ATPase [Isosphaeraceae bacterium]
MKIARIDLLAFGSFTDLTLDLSGGREGLHVVFGPNEAGKSTALRAIRQALCGIDVRSTDNFLHKHKDMAIGMTLRNARGEEFAFVRRKGAKNTLLQPDRSPLEDDALARFLGRIVPEEFATRYAIDHGELIQGGKELVAGRGDLGASLFSAGAGLAGLGAIQKRLEQDCEVLFKRGGSNPLINANIARLDAATRERKEASLPSSEWVAHDEALRQAKDRKQAVETALAEARRDARRRKRVRDALEPIARRKEALAHLDPVADAVLLPADFTTKRREALSLLKPTENAAREARQKRGALARELETIKVPEAVLAHASEIETLRDRLGVHQQALREQERLRVEAAQHEADAEAILRDLATPTEGRAAPTAADRAEVQDLATDSQAVRQSRDEARKALEKHAAKRGEVARKLAALGDERDPAPLKKAVGQAQKANLDEALDAARLALKKGERQAAAALEALGLWTGALDDLPRLPVPSDETIERCRAEQEEARRDRDALAARRDELDAHGRDVEAAIARLRLEGEVPTEDDLTAARDQRETLWRQLRAAWSEPAADAFEPAVANADKLADRLRREAQRVAEKAKLFADRERNAQALDDYRARLILAEERLRTLDTRWSALWAPLSVTPLSPREMLAWTRKQATLAALVHSLDEQRQAIAHQEERVALHRRSVGAALDALGRAEAKPAESLSDLLEHAEAALEAILEAASARKRLQKDMAEREAEQPALEERAEVAEAALQRWQERWARAMERLGLAADASPAQANAVLVRLAELADKRAKTQDNRRRIEAIAREATEFGADARALAERVAPDLAAAGTEIIAAELGERLKNARSAAQRHAHRTELLDQEEQTLRNAEKTIQEMKGCLAALCREARCASEDDLPELEQRSERRRLAEQQLAALDQQLRLLAGPEPLDAFLAEAEAADPDQLDVEIARLDESAQTLEREKEDCDQAIGRESTILARMDGSALAAEKEEEAEGLKARIKEDVEQYARLRLAATLLREGIERYRQKSQGPVLARAGRLFSALTLGSFAGLTVDYDDRDEPVLLGTRPDAGTPVGIEGMSLGTADQLYLALRLASIESAVDPTDPAPLIVDDILIQFDDARSGATLDVLGALSRKTQVIVFTHHQHLCELARTRLDSEVLFIHQLPGREVGVNGTPATHG